jgi:hypothetical protein
LGGGVTDPGQVGELIPRPDPTVLTATAVSQAKEDLRRELASVRELLEERVTALDRLAGRRMDDADKAVAAALASAEKAVVKAETASERRFAAVNEFRQVLSDQTASFMPRIEYRTAHEALGGRVEQLTERLAALELRLTSRLDSGEGSTRGAAGYRSERRLDVGVIIAVVAVLVSLGTAVVLGLR